MNTIQIRDFINSDNNLKSLFHGVFARDELIMNIKYPSCFIVNTDNSNQSGSHWLAFFYDVNKHVKNM